MGWSTVQPKTLVPSTSGAMEKPVVPRERLSGIERGCGDEGMRTRCHPSTPLGMTRANAQTPNRLPLAAVVNAR